MSTRFKPVLNNRKPICRHGNCQADRMEKSLYCEFQDPMHRKAPIAHDSEIDPVPEWMLKAGNARRVKGRVRT